MRVIEPDDVVLGQYIGYKYDPTIENIDSVTPTYACMSTSVNSPTWAGVPFILEAGKALNDRVCEVRLHFHRDIEHQEEALILRLQPKPSIYLTTTIKRPGFENATTATALSMD